MQSKRTSKKILSLLLALCMVLTMLPMTAFADGSDTINITGQPTYSLSTTFGESPGSISVTATTTNNAPISYEWYMKTDGSTCNGMGYESIYSIPADLSPGTYGFYCKLTAEGCDPITSDSTVVTVSKAPYTGSTSDTVLVKAGQATTGHVYTLPSFVSDMSYTVDGSGSSSSLIEGTPVVEKEDTFPWEWKLTFNTSAQPDGTEEDIELKINGGYFYEDSTFTLTIKAVDKQLVSITGLTGTDNAYTGTPQIGYTGTPNTGAYTGLLEALYSGRNTTSYDSSATPPTDAGEYTVTLSVPSEAEYTGSLAIDFSIRKKEITVQPISYTILQGDELPNPNFMINYIGFNSAQGHNSANSISTWAVAKLNITDSNTPGVSDITFETYAELTSEKAKNYTLKHENGMLTIQAGSTFAVNGTMNIGGETDKDLTSNQSGNGWSWNAATATLTLDSSYTGEPISINCDSEDTINLVYTGDISITSSASSTIYCKGSLNITGSGGTLTLNSIGSNDSYCAIEVFRALAIGGSADVDAACAGTTTNIDATVIYAMNGVTVSHSANVTAAATGTDASGIYVEYGDVTISTTGTVTATGKGTGGALALKNGRALKISNGTLALSGNPFSGNQYAKLNITGGSITIGGTPVYLALLTLSGVDSVTEVTAVSTPPSGYGIPGKSTDSSGQLYFLLPAGSQTVTLTAGGNTYTGTVVVTTDHAATATLTTGGTTPTDITADFTDANFLAAVRTVLGKASADPIYATEAASITTLDVAFKNIANLAGLEHFTALTELDCGGNNLTALPELPGSLTYLECNNNSLTALALNSSAAYTYINVSYNNIASTDDVTGNSITWGDNNFIFAPQRTPVPSSNANLASLTVNAGTLSPSFYPSVTSYNVSVAYSTNSITIGTTAEAGATISGGQMHALKVGVNTIPVVVTAADGVTTKTYTITVTRAAYSGGGGSTTPAPTPTSDPSTYPVTGNSAESWSGVMQALKGGDAGQITISMTGTTVLPGSVLQELAGTNQTITITLGNGISWSISGNEIKKTGKDGSAPDWKDIDLKVALGAGQIPEKTLEELAAQTGAENAEGILLLSLSHEGSFGFTPRLSVSAGSSQAGRTANLFYYNPATGQMELVCIAKVDAQGNTVFPFSHASDYAIAVDDGAILKEELDKLVLTPAKKTLYVGGNIGKSAALKVNLPDSLSTLTKEDSLYPAVTYTSSNPKVASVTADGKVTAKKAGKATITAKVTAGGVSKVLKTDIMVQKAYIKLVKTKSSLKKGESFTYTATGYGVSTDKITWTTTKKSIVVINKKTGKATAKSNGTDTVVAKYGSVQKVIKVTVK